MCWTTKDNGRRRELIQLRDGALIAVYHDTSSSGPYYGRLDLTAFAWARMPQHGLYCDYDSCKLGPMFGFVFRCKTVSEAEGVSLGDGRERLMSSTPAGSAPSQEKIALIFARLTWNEAVQSTFRGTSSIACLVRMQSRTLRSTRRRCSTFQRSRPSARALSLSC